jgi:hypothetical protein
MGSFHFIFSLYKKREENIDELQRFSSRRFPKG